MGHHNLRNEHQNGIFQVWWIILYVLPKFAENFLYTKKEQK